MPRPCTMSPAMALLLCLAMLSSGGWCGGCRDDERATLLDIRGQFNYNSPLDWNSTDCCRWEGVSCSSPTARVTGLDLSILHSIASSRGLLNTTMFLPLQELQDLSLSGLKIQGCTPGAGNSP
uniref:Leucine-rich repeat-containing N-terminal plant-type domain-containing protein n=1 Tax=Aegilops tauschii subsp. strangulata TaxID=200361 RepID=A0A453QX55_AEGTS